MFDLIGRFGGFHYYSEQLASAVADRGWSMSLVTVDAASNGNSEKFKRISLFAGIFGPGAVVVRAALLAIALVRSLVLLFMRRPAIVHIHVFRFNWRELCLALAGRVCGSKIVATVHDVQPFGQRALFRGVLLRFTHRCIVHNTYSKEQLIKVGAKSESISIVPHGDYLSLFASAPSTLSAREALGLPHSGFIGLFFGNPKREKGLDVLLDAARLVTRHVTIVVAGKGAQSQVDAIISGMRPCPTDCSTVVVRDGLVSDDEAVLFYRAASMVILPYRESFASGVAIMARSASRRAIASDLPALRDALGDDAMYFPSGDIQGLAQCIDEAVGRYCDGVEDEVAPNPELAWANIAEKTIDVYWDLGNGRRN
jgi:D-inositol-3-phosphate glycosyltransferase